MNDSRQIEEQEGLGKKILFIPPTYGDESSLSRLEEHEGRDVRQEQATLRVFEEVGFLIERNNNYTGKQGELALMLSNVLAHGSHRILDDEITRNTKIPRPKELTVDEVRKSQFPVVVKNTSQHGGDGIFLLESNEAWTRFVARAMMTQKLSDLFYEPNYEKVIEDVEDRIKKWDFNSEWFFYKNPKELEYYQYQEYISTPSEYHTSFRVLADAYGEVYSGVLIRSAKVKGEERLNNPEMQLSNDPIEEVSHSPRPYDILLMHPNSPFFLNSPKIVSNAVQGGVVIPLKGDVEKDYVNRQVLIAHGINPDNPTIPSVMLERASAIGKAARGMNAYVGVDFMMNEEKDPLFLEANFGPILTPDEIGIAPPSIYITRSSNLTTQYCQIVLLEKIANKL